MRLFLLSVLCSVAAGAQSGAQLGLPPGVLLLSRIKHNMQNTLDRLPAYACLENVDRLIRESPKKPIRALDALRLEVMVSHNQELFSWPDDLSSFRDDITVPGLNSSGEFFSTAKALFSRDSSAVIKYRGREPLDGTLAARYDFTISSMFFHSTLDIDGRQATVDTAGSFWADPATADLLRLTDHPAAIPPELETLSLVTIVDYSRLLLGGQPFLFPQTAVVTLARSNGAESQNRIEFTHCRQYSVESHLAASTTVTPAPAPAPASVEFQVPPDMLFPVRRTAAVDLTRGRGGDPIRGVLTSNVRHKHDPIAPKGAVLLGRVRMLIHDHGQGKIFLTAGFEFTDLEFTDGSGVRHHAPFYAFLRDLTALPGIAREISTSKVQREDGTDLGWIDMRQTETLTPPVLPGVATLFIDAGRHTLPKGFEFDWISATFPHHF